MLRLALALILVGAPPAEAEASDAIPRFDELPPPPPPPPVHAERVQVPATGAGMITLGSLALGAGSMIGFAALGMHRLGNPDNGNPSLAAFMVMPHVITGTVLLALGFVIRKQYRAKPASRVPDQPPTGGGMIIAGSGLMLGGLAYAAQAAVDLSTESCSFNFNDGTSVCGPVRPIGAPIQLGAAIAAFGTGATLVAFGAQRRKRFVDWARYQPLFHVQKQQAVFGVAGRF